MIVITVKWDAGGYSSFYADHAAELLDCGAKGGVPIPALASPRWEVAVDGAPVCIL